MISDPTREEMLHYLNMQPSLTRDADEFDMESAIYWFAHHYHAGQDSNLYAALCASPYSPGPGCNGPDKDGIGAMLYEELEWRFARKREAE